MSQRGVWQGQWDYPVILPVRLSDQGAGGPGCPQEGPARGWGSCSRSADPMVGRRGDFKPSSLQPKDTQGRAVRPEAVSCRDMIPPRSVTPGLYLRSLLQLPLVLPPASPSSLLIYNAR